MTALLVSTAAMVLMACATVEEPPAKTGEVHGYLARPAVQCPPTCTVDEAIRSAASTYGVSYARLNCLAFRESTWNPNARNGPYAGLMQFDGITWALTPYREHSVWNAWASANAAAYLISRGEGQRWPLWARGEC